MRIIAGEKKGTILFGPTTDKIRPTTDRAKESLFNIINYKIKNSSFLDLYGGTGAISLEAKSRGAKEVYIVDKEVQSLKTIKQNMNKTKLKLNIVQSDVEKFLKCNTQKYEIIFMDPPFMLLDKDIKKNIELIKQNKILKPSGTLIVERATKQENKELYQEYNCKIKKYGNVSFIIMENL